jgi:hypothetical protein
MRSAQGYRRPRELTGPPLSKSKKKIHSKMRCIEILKRVYESSIGAAIDRNALCDDDEKHFQNMYAGAWPGG